MVRTDRVERIVGTQHQVNVLLVVEMYTGTPVSVLQIFPVVVVARLLVTKNARGILGCQDHLRDLPFLVERPDKCKVPVERACVCIV